MNGINENQSQLENLQRKMFIMFICLIWLSRPSVQEIDLEDILSQDLMPTELLVLENFKMNGNSENIRKELRENEIIDVDNGSLVKAMETMGYHR